MRINNISRGKSSYRLGFKSLRTDKNTAVQLKKGEKPLIENNKQNIYAALNNLSAKPERENISFLLDIADNLAYGQDGESEFKHALDMDGLTPAERENTDWSELLADTIQKALKGSDENVEDLQSEYDRIFGGEKPLTEDQKKILDLRKTLTEKICSDEAIEDYESLTRAANIRKNLDYFVASSEVPSKQKEECLDKFIYFLSDDYKINPQLQDKKFQVLDEMLNDMLIKTPENDVYTIKDVNQKYTGMCAAISVCRKAIAYEDKSNYVDIILDELKDSPTMSVYDITELDSGKKIEIPKADIDYNTALDLGYRIIDTSAHLWMQNAHAQGDGTIMASTYIPFDKESYGIYDDSTWYEGLNTSVPEEKVLLKALIKEKENLESLMCQKDKIKSSHSNIMAAKKDAAEFQSEAQAKLTSDLKTVFPDKTAGEISALQKDLFTFYKGSSEDNEVNLPSSLPEKDKQAKIESFIIEKNPDISEEQKQKLSEKSGNILKMTEKYVSADKSIKGLKFFSTERGKYLYYKKLFNLAAAHRLAIEADVNMTDGVVRFERIVGLPVRETQITDYMQTLKNNAKSPAIQAQFAKNVRGKVDEKKLDRAISKDMIELETKIPAEIDGILNVLYGKDLTKCTMQMYSALISAVKEGDKEQTATVAKKFGIKNDKKEVLKALEKWHGKLKNSPAPQDRNEAIRLLGYQNSMQLSTVLVSSFIESVKGGISQEEYNRLIDTFGGEQNVSIGISSARNRFVDLQHKYVDLLDKWQVPDTRELILEKLEKNNSVLSRKKLDMLDSRFASIRKETVKNDSIKNIKERTKANSKLYTFTNDEKDVLRLIEKTVPAMKKYCKMSYHSMNNAFKDELEEQYSKIGMLDGQFWVREEGSTGLVGNEQIRILEQMTGKPYHLERDLKNAVKSVKQGEGSGVISMSVEDDDYGFHAQYVPFVTQQKMKNADGKEAVQDIVWTDNSWGRTERDRHWKDENNLVRTDYGSGMGWKKGFITNENYLTGFAVPELDGVVGKHKESGNKSDDMPDTYTDFELFSHMVLPGVPQKTYQKLYEMFEQISMLKSYGQVYDNLEQDVLNGADLNLDLLTGIDDIASERYYAISKKLEKEINSEEDFNKLPKDDEVRFYMDKLALYMASDNPLCSSAVNKATTREQLDEVQQKMRETHFETIASALAKSQESIVERTKLMNITCNDLDKLLNSLGEQFGTEISESDKNKLIQDIFTDFGYETFSKPDGSLSSLETYLLNKTAEAACDYLDDEHIAVAFIPKAQEIIQKAIDENLRITSLQSPAIEECPLRDELLNMVDKYFNPKSDEDLIKILQTLQDADLDTVNKFSETLTDEDLGIIMRPAYEYVVKYKAGDSDIERSLSELVASDVIYSEVDYNDDEDDENQTPDSLFRTLYVKLSDLNTQKYVKAFKAEAFQKYSVRQAFPNPIVLDDKNIEETTIGIFDSLKQDVGSIQGGEDFIKLFNSYESLIDDVSKTPLYADIMKMSNRLVSEYDEKDVNLLKEKLYSLYDVSLDDSSFAPILEATRSMLTKLNSEKQDTTCRELATDIKALNSVIADWETSAITKERFINVNKETLNTLREKIQVFCNANIEPKYCDEIINKYKKLVTMYKNEASEEEIEDLENEIIDFVIDRHITKNPVKLLEECVKDIYKGKTDTDEYLAKKTYLKTALQIANQTKIQYKLVQHQHEGISSKLKDMLPVFNVALSDGSLVSMKDDVGISYLVNQLQNENDDNVTLNLFLNQSGLAKRAVTALIDTFDVDAIKGMIDEKYQDLNKKLVELEAVSNEINKYLDSNETKYRSLPDAVKDMSTYIDRKFAGKDNEVAEKYSQYLNSLQFDKSQLSIAPSMMSTYIDSINEDALNLSLENDINYNIKFMSEIQSLVQERVDLISAITVPQNSEEARKREEFEERCDLSTMYIQQLLNEVSATLNDSEVFGTE